MEAFKIGTFYKLYQVYPHLYPQIIGINKNHEMVKKRDFINNWDKFFNGM